MANKDFSHEHLVDTKSKRQEVSRIINNCLTFYEMGRNRVTTLEELEERLAFFYVKCAETGQIPTVEKMCMALGYARGTVWDWEAKNHCGLKGNISDVSDVIKKAKEFMASFDAELLLENKMNPVAYIFRAKNYYKMTDKQEYVVEAKNPLGEVKTIEEIAREIPQDLLETKEK